VSRLDLLDISLAPVIVDDLEHLLACVRAGDIVGHVAEFGVWRGTSITRLAHAVRPELVHGFDTFRGLPEAWDRGADVYPAGHFDTGGELPRVPANVRLYPGLFVDTLPAWLATHPGPFRFINIDADLYASAWDVLTLCDARIVPGTVIRFDELVDWQGSGVYSTWADGEWRALNDWLVQFERRVRPLSRAAGFAGAVVLEQ